MTKFRLALWCLALLVLLVAPQLVAGIALAWLVSWLLLRDRPARRFKIRKAMSFREDGEAIRERLARQCESDNRHLRHQAMDLSRHLLGLGRGELEALGPRGVAGRLRGRNFRS